MARTKRKLCIAFYEGSLQWNRVGHVLRNGQRGGPCRREIIVVRVRSGTQHCLRCANNGGREPIGKSNNGRQRRRRRRYVKNNKRYRHKSPESSAAFLSITVASDPRSRLTVFPSYPCGRLFVVKRPSPERMSRRPIVGYVHTARLVRSQRPLQI